MDTKSRVRVYYFDELSGKAREKARDRFRAGAIKTAQSYLNRMARLGADLAREYGYIVSDESVDSAIRADAHTFKRDGTRID